MTAANTQPIRPLLLLARLVVTGVFLAAALPKLRDPDSFAVAVQSFRLVGITLAAWIALLLPWLELVAAAGWLLPPLRRASGNILGLLLASFIALHASAWARGIDAECGCFGAAQGDATGYAWLILRNLALLAILLPVLLADWRAGKKSLAPRPPGSLHAEATHTGGRP